MVRLVPMGEEEYREYAEFSVPNYAQEQVKAGVWNPEDALQLAEKTFRSLLPDGLASPGQYLRTIVDKELDQRVGFLWYGLRDEGAGEIVVLYEIVIFERYRRQGYGGQALEALEEEARKLEVCRVQLHVFGHNEIARSLYKKLGYVERNVTMVKRVCDEGTHGA